jgi:hypothetical protein
MTVMRQTSRRWVSVSALLPILIAGWCGLPARALAQAADAASADIVLGAWQHHKASFNYVGFTSLYTCDALEDNVRQILRYLGARKDARASATGCVGSFHTPSRTAFVNADFYSLAPIGDAEGADAVKAGWTQFSLAPRRPDFMGEGDCELVQAMKDLITKNFSLRDLEYRTECVPNEVTLDSFAVKGQVLKTLPSNSKPVKG